MHCNSFAGRDFMLRFWASTNNGLKELMEWDFVEQLMESEMYEGNWSCMHKNQ
jgi:hypothetical protein